MLVYIRDSDRDKIMCEVQQRDIAEHLRLRLQREQEEKEKKRKEKSEAHLYTQIKVAVDGDFKSQIGNDIHFDLVDHEKVKSFRVQKQTPFINFKQQIEDELGIPIKNQRFWMWAKRQNHTYRPNRPLTAQEEMQQVVQIKETTSKTVNDLKLFLEVPNGKTELPTIQRKEILLFFKFYDPVKQTVEFVGRLFAHLNTKIYDLRSNMCEMANLAPNEEVVAY